jgi:hypothetical protein
MSLKYLFSCEYKDGTTYHQNSEDVSIQDPTRSSFFDVKLDELKIFQLVNQINNDLITVDLIDGHFQVNDISFKLHDDQDKLTNEFRLIFFRRHKHKFNLDREELSHNITYRIGWQCNDVDGKNIQRVMEII